MVLEVIEGQIRGGYFPDCILDPSVIDCSVQFMFIKFLGLSQIFQVSSVVRHPVESKSFFFSMTTHNEQ